MEAVRLKSFIPPSPCYFTVRDTLTRAEVHESLSVTHIPLWATVVAVHHVTQKAFDYKMWLLTLLVMNSNERLYDKTNLYVQILSCFPEGSVWGSSRRRPGTDHQQKILIPRHLVGVFNIIRSLFYRWKTYSCAFGDLYRVTTNSVIFYSLSVNHLITELCSILLHCYLVKFCISLACVKRYMSEVTVQFRECFSR